MALAGGMTLHLVLSRAYLRAAATVVVTLAALLPPIGYVATSFLTTAAGAATERDHILAIDVIPQHSQPGQWFDAGAAAGFSLVIVALLAVRIRAFRTLIFIPLLIGVLGTIAQMLTGSNGLALIFPWRVSVWVFPLACTALAALGVHLFGPVVERDRLVRAAFFGTVAGLLAIALAAKVSFVIGERSDRPSYTAAAEMVRTGSPRNAVVMVDPDSGEDFRLLAQRPTFADWKTHPYEASAVTAWFERVSTVRDLYRELDTEPCAAVRAAPSLGVTLVLEPTSTRPCPAASTYYEDDDWRVYHASTFGG